MRISLSSIFVNDQEQALRFYTEILGFEKKEDIPMGEARWLTVTSPGGPDGVELVLEPDAHPAAKTFREALFEDGIPQTSFGASDVRAEYERLRNLGVVFRGEPMEAGTTVLAIFEDGCGNLVQIHQD